MALKSADMINKDAISNGKPAPLSMDEGAYDGIRSWLDRVTDESTGRVGYMTRGTGSARPQELMDRFPADKSEAMTGVGMFSVIEKATGRWVGRLGPWYPEGWPDAEVGWGIVRAHWGKGYASEGAAVAMDYAFDALGWTRVIHCIDPRNDGSVGVARKLGSRKLGRVPMPPPYETVEMDAWGQTREEWRARPRS